MNEEKLALFRLFLAADVGFVRFFKLLEIFGNAKSVLGASRKDLLSVYGIGNKIADSILDVSLPKRAETELQKALKNDIKIVLYTDPKYPECLSNINDKPIALYIKGSFNKSDINSLSIVGSRRVSNYGKAVTEEFATFFAKREVPVVSGLARGVDSIAHKSALENNSRTIAVLGNGLLVNYPPENAKLQAKIAENGAIISEFPLEKQPEKGTFPRRNRIIAALSKATLVTEASIKSGAIITAKFAADYGKDVYAVPGNIYSNYSQGTNDLIKNGAYVALSPKDMFESLTYFNTYNNRVPVSGKHIELENTQQQILNIIENNFDGIHFDTIVQKTGMSISEISAVIFKLELNGLIKVMPGQMYIRIRQ